MGGPRDENQLLLARNNRNDFYDAARDDVNEFDCDDDDDDDDDFVCETPPSSGRYNAHRSAQSSLNERAEFSLGGGNGERTKIGFRVWPFERANREFKKFEQDVRKHYQNYVNARTIRVLLTVVFISSALAVGASFGSRFGGDLYVKVRPKRESAIGKSRQHAEVEATMIDTEKYPNARCLDGTPGLYYASFAPSSGIAKKAHYKNLAGSGDKFVKKSEAEIASSAMDGFSTHRTWVIMLNGGGECVNEKKCQERAETELGSSSLAAPTHTFKSGLTELHETHNPAFMYANMVVVNYCSGDSFLGRAMDADSSGAWHSGGHIVDAVLDTLLERHEMKNADRILIAGRSSAGIGVLSQADRWRTMIERSANSGDWWTHFRRSKPVPKVYAAPFAGFRYTHSTEDDDKVAQAGKSTATDAATNEAAKQSSTNKKKSRKNAVASYARRSLLETKTFSSSSKEEKFNSVGSKLLSSPGSNVANRDLGIKEEVDRTKKRIDLLETRKKIEAIETKKKIDLLEIVKKVEELEKAHLERHQKSSSAKTEEEEEENAVVAAMLGKPVIEKNKNNNNDVVVVSPEEEKEKEDTESSASSATRQLDAKEGLKAKIVQKVAQQKMEYGGNDPHEWQQYIKYWHAKHSLNKACVAKNEENYWKCASAEEAFKHVKTPVFISQALTDALLAGMVGDNTSPYGLTSDPSNPSIEGSLGAREKEVLKTLTSADILNMDIKEEGSEILRLMSLNATAREIYAENLMKLMRAELKTVVEHPNAGLFAPACYAHNDFDDVYIDGIDHHTALAWWVFKDSNVKLVDTCSGVFCNPTCKHSLAESSIIPRVNEDGTNVKQGSSASLEATKGSSK